MLQTPGSLLFEPSTPQLTRASQHTINKENAKSFQPSSTKQLNKNRVALGDLSNLRKSVGTTPVIEKAHASSAQTGFAPKPSTSAASKEKAKLQQKQLVVEPPELTHLSFIPEPVDPLLQDIDVKRICAPALPFPSAFQYRPQHKRYDNDLVLSFEHIEMPVPDFDDICNTELDELDLELNLPAID